MSITSVKLAVSENCNLKNINLDCFEIIESASFYYSYVD